MTPNAPTQLDLREFERTRFDQLEDEIKEGNHGRVRELARAVQEEFVPVHDGFVDMVTATLSHFVDLTSPEEGETLGLEAMERHMAGPWFEQYLGAHGDSPEALRRRIVNVATTWHWHPSHLTITEDDDKVTFNTHPCGSGMRLEQRGRYDGQNGFRRSVKPSPSAFMETDFPIYCNHCPQMNRAGLREGATVWLVEGWKPIRDRERGTCRQHSYKRLEDVPEEFFARVGLERPTHMQPQPSLHVRLFTDEELAELATHPCDRLVRTFETGSTEEALAALEYCRDGWTGMHDSYPIYMAILWAVAEQAFGHDGFIVTLEQAGPELVASMRDRDARQWAAFWAMHLRLREIRDTGDGWEFVVGSNALLDAETFTGSTEEFCSAMNRGLTARGWDAVGTFRADGDAIVHCLHTTTRSSAST